MLSSSKELLLFHYRRQRTGAYNSNHHDGRESVEVNIGSRRRLSELTWEERRDQLIAALDLFSEENNNNNTSDSVDASYSTFSTSSVSTKFLLYVGMDIIDNSKVPNDKLFNLAFHLPCLETAPTKNYFYKSVQRKLPNDYDKENQWHYQAIGLPQAWQCNNGQNTTVVVAVIDSGCSFNPDLEGKEISY